MVRFQAAPRQETHDGKRRRCPDKQKIARGLANSYLTDAADPDHPGKTQIVRSDYQEFKLDGSKK
jgi:hypothetical protein